MSHNQLSNRQSQAPRWWDALGPESRKPALLLSFLRTAWHTRDSEWRRWLVQIRWCGFTPLNTGIKNDKLCSRPWRGNSSGQAFSCLALVTQVCSSFLYFIFRALTDRGKHCCLVEVRAGRYISCVCNCCLDSALVRKSEELPQFNNNLSVQTRAPSPEIVGCKIF